MDPGVTSLRGRADREELDYGFVMECLKSYKNPRVKLNHLLKNGVLVRIKKGIYVFGQAFSRRSFSKEILANMIYGPSYVSLEWACQHYRLIPERVRTVTSVTLKRRNQFHTPVGLFTYDHLLLEAYPVGVCLKSVGENVNALFATKEKALTDLLVLRRGAIYSKKQFREVVFEDLRIEEEDLLNLDLKLLMEIYSARPHSAVEHLIEWRRS